MTMMSFQAIEQVTKTQGHSTNASYESSPNTKKSTFTLRITLGQDHACLYFVALYII